MRSVIGVEVGGTDEVDSSGWAVRLSRESVRVMLAVWDRPMDVAGKSRLADMSVNGLSAWKGGIEVSSSWQWHVNWTHATHCDDRGSRISALMIPVDSPHRQYNRTRPRLRGFC